MDNNGLTETQAMDKQIAERLFGWNYVSGKGWDSVAGFVDRVPYYSTDLGDAAPVWAWIRERWAKDETGTISGSVLLELDAIRDDLGSHVSDAWRWFFMQADVPLTLCRVALALLDAEETKTDG